MEDGLKVLGAAITLLGTCFLFLGALGVVRMPDPYNRIQAGTKASTLGVILALGGLAIYEPEWLSKLALVALFIVITNPVSSHALARAAHRAGIPLAEVTVRDELAEAEAPPPEPEAEEGSKAGEEEKEETKT